MLSVRAVCPLFTLFYTSFSNREPCVARDLRQQTPCVACYCMQEVTPYHALYRPHQARRPPLRQWRVPVREERRVVAVQGWLRPQPDLRALLPHLPRSERRGLPEGGPSVLVAGWCAGRRHGALKQTTRIVRGAVVWCVAAMVVTRACVSVCSRRQRVIIDSSMAMGEGRGVVSLTAALRQQRVSSGPWSNELGCFPKPW